MAAHNPDEFHFPETKHEEFNKFALKQQQKKQTSNKTGNSVSVISTLFFVFFLYFRCQSSQEVRS